MTLSEEYPVFRSLTGKDESLSHSRRRNVMQRVCVSVVLVSLLVIFAAGCGALSSMLAEPEWSENYALDAQCTVPEMNDGSMYSSGKTLPAEYVKGQRADDSRFTDVILTFKESKEVRRITVRRRSEDAVPVDINVFAMIKDEWKLVSDSTRGEVEDSMNINLRAASDKIKIRAQRATRTAKGKAAITKGIEGSARRTQMERILREPLKFAEIEVYGLKPKTETAES
jgi:hypothetical protein